MANSFSCPAAAKTLNYNFKMESAIIGTLVNIVMLCPYQRTFSPPFPVPMMAYNTLRGDFPERDTKSNKNLCIYRKM